MASSTPSPDMVLRVSRKETVADGVVSIELEAPDGSVLPMWTAGAHIDLHCAGPDGTMVRQYSLCGDTSDRRSYRIGVRRDESGRGGSRWVHDTLTVGDAVGVGGPRNNFPLVDAPQYVFVAGGIGVTPILPMIAAANASGASWSLAYGGRNRASMPFCDHAALQGSGSVSIVPEDELGLLDLDALFADPAPGTAVYCCGPEPLLQAMEKRAAAWTEATLYIERFTAKEIETEADTAFEVEIASTGKVLTVPSDRSTLEVLLDAGLPVLFACEEGTCASCETKVICGEVEHRDSLLRPEEQAANNVMFPCVSRAKSARIVLDL